MSALTNGTHEPLQNGRPSDGIYTASSVAEIRASLDELAQRESKVTARLDNLLASQKDLNLATRNISHGMLSSASRTATRISSAVRNLDREQAAVKSTLEVVEQVAELKACVLGVSGSMGAPQDWETAANYLQRARQIPDAVIDGAFAEEIVPTSEVPDPPRQTLDAASESLCGLFLREFEKAAQEGDGARVTRFFKLFPLLGRSEVGLDAYGRYVCGGVSSRARTNMNNSARQGQGGMFYANALTKLFEHIAQIVDGHEPLVERHYGAGSMTRVIERIQAEADVQGGIILDTWAEEGRVARKLTDVKSYPFNFLVQSFLPSSKPSALGNTPRSGSPAPGGRRSEDDAVDMKEVDALLNESAVMLGRWTLYNRFIASKTAPSETGSDESLHIPAFIMNSNLNRRITSNLIDPFNVMSTFFFRRSVEKSFQLDESPSNLTLNPGKALPASAQPPFITSAVDDVMYIVNQVLQRTLGTGQKTVVGSVIPSIGRVLGSDFFGMVQRRMRDECYPKAAIQGALPPENVIIAFLVLMNSLDVATDYLKRIIRSSVGVSGTEAAADALADKFPFGHEASFVAKALRNVESGFEAKTGELIGEAVEVMLKQVMRPRLRPVMIETFRDADYLASSEEDAQGQEEQDSPDADIVPKRFDRGWSAFTLPIKRILSPANYDKLLSSTVSYLARTLEKRIWGFYGRVNALGAVRLERDLAGIVAAAVKGGRYELRDLFARCTQIVLVVNMEEDEWEEISRLDGRELERVTGVVWKLDDGERKRARGLLQ
ncbi:Golgi transport complex subunit 4 [Saxophila tyrrhenica]|uniref:Conserved oligomeric Golgi complex subunit 4 n=1 Tax=Saxophila tyrrhenica TaxID=1690608 RepID=A0AAV9P8G6_9PEZI|nr:Golgi transport complex subunit 4 [Saxophila tyrrhenica]